MSSTDVLITRRTNLRHLIQSYHGPTALALKLGYSNGSFLVQIAGPNPIRPLTEKSARKFERLLQLERGWFDKEHSGVIEYARAAPDQPIDSNRLADCVAAISHAAEDLGIELSPDKFGNLAALLYEHAGPDLHEHALRLVKLAA